MSLFGSSEERERKNQIENLQGDLADLDAAIHQLRDGTNESHAAKWEYASLDDVEVSVLDQYGARGWELVNALSYTTGFGLGGNSTMTVHTRYVFKRMIAEALGSADFSALLDRRAEIEAEISRLS